MIRKIKMIIFATATLSLIHCGGKGGSSTPPTSQAAVDANQIQINDNGNVITWSQAANNIYIAAANGCVLGLNTNSDDSTPAQRSEELALLINASQINKGGQSSPGLDSVYLNISYNSGETRTFNLRTESAATSEDTLSNGAEILTFFDRISVELQSNGRINCNNGKK